MKFLIIILGVGLLFWGCEKPPSYSNKPVITFKSVTPNIIRSFTDTFADAQSLPDTLRIEIGFTDGNGEIGIPSGDTSGTNVDAFLTDSRKAPNGQYAVDPIRIPYITPDGNIKAISGTISFTVSDLAGNLDGLHPDWDTMHYTITIEDRNGNMSNAVVTTPIYIKDN